MGKTDFDGREGGQALGEGREGGASLELEALGDEGGDFRRTTILFLINLRVADQIVCSPWRKSLSSRAKSCWKS